MSNKLQDPSSELISLAQAIEMNANYRNDKDKLLAPGVNPDVLPTCITYSSSNIQRLISQPNCVEIRTYFSMNADGNVCLVIVGVNGKGEDIIEPDQLIVDNGERCPYQCPPPSPLNS